MKTTRYKALAAALAAIMAVSATACAANTAQTNPIPESDVSVSDENSAAESTESVESADSTATESAVSDAESATESNESKDSVESKTESKPETTEKQDKPATTPANSDPASTPASTKPADKPVTTKAATTKAATTKTTTKATTKATAPAPAWKETKMSATMYVNTAGIYSRSKAQLGAPTVKQYNLNDKVTVVAVTNTDYYKLSDGNFIHKDYLGMDKVTVQTAKPNTTKPSTTAKQNTSKPSTSTTAKPNSWREGETEEHYNAALKVAKKIADEVRAEVGSERSLKQIALATDKVAEYYDKCSYDDTKVVNWSAWGVFIGKEASCAGATKALGMVLEQLGFEWEHMYEHSSGHQFCKVVNFFYNEKNIYADADGDITGCTLGFGQGIGFSDRFMYIEGDEDVFFWC